MDIKPIQTIEQAVQYIQSIPIQRQQSIFEYLYADMIDYQSRSKINQEKRQFGLYQGKGGFKLSDDWEMGEEELLGL
ncbi:MAG: hypothetical protein Q3971_07695 [Moraxella sp.]|nr:hypothetical protein [Moraxella sp.]